MLADLDDLALELAREQASYLNISNLLWDELRHQNADIRQAHASEVRQKRQCK